jgi:hypothetical protein
MSKAANVYQRIIISLLSSGTSLRSITYILHPHLSRNTLEQLGHNLRSVALEKPVLLIQPPSRYIVLIHIDNRHSCALRPRKIHISRGGIHFRARANDKYEVDFLGLAHELIDGIEYVAGELFAKPDDAGAQEACFACWALGQMGVCEFGDGDGFVGDVELAAGFEGCGVGFVGREGKRGDDGVGVVVALDVVAEELGAFHIEEGAVEEFELGGGVVGAWGEACCQRSVRFGRLRLRWDVPSTF